MYVNFFSRLVCARKTKQSQFLGGMLALLTLASDPISSRVLQRTRRPARQRSRRTTPRAAPPPPASPPSPRYPSPSRPPPGCSRPPPLISFSILTTHMVVHYYELLDTYVQTVVSTREILPGLFVCFFHVLIPFFRCTVICY